MYAWGVGIQSLHPRCKSIADLKTDLEISAFYPRKQKPRLAQWHDSGASIFCRIPKGNPPDWLLTLGWKLHQAMRLFWEYCNYMLIVCYQWNQYVVNFFSRKEKYIVLFRNKLSTLWTQSWVKNKEFSSKKKIFLIIYRIGVAGCVVNFIVWW